jgi:hypothetical protein
MRLSLHADHQGRRDRLFKAAQEASAESAEDLLKANEIRGDDLHDKMQHRRLKRLATDAVAIARPRAMRNRSILPPAMSAFAASSEKAPKMSSHDERNKLNPKTNTPSRRNVLLGGTTLVAASAVTSGGRLRVAQAQQQPAASSGRPNIVFILVDNTGWGDFGVYGGTTATPRIDKLASEGIRFNNYNVEAQCTPTRSAIMTGRHPVRSGTSSIAPPAGGKMGLVPWENTIAKLLSDAGYATALYGKWHLGDTQGRLPNDQGFDEWWGIPNTWDEAGYSSYPLFNDLVKEVLAKEKVPELLDLPPHILEGRKGQPSKPVMDLDMKVRPIVDKEYLIPKTVDFIKRQAAAKKPFFVYLGYSELHPPSVPNP